jgi:signal transduction histidine kinase
MREAVAASLEATAFETDSLRAVEAQYGDARFGRTLEGLIEARRELAAWPPADGPETMGRLGLLIDTFRLRADQLRRMHLDAADEIRGAVQGRLDQSGLVALGVILLAIAVGGFLILAILRNVRQIETQRLENLAHAVEASRAKSEFLTMMSHELRTPLNAILGFSDVLMNQYFGPPGAGRYRAYAADIHASGMHLLELIEDILDLSSIEAGKVNLHFAAIDLARLADECVTIVRRRADERKIRLTTDFPPDLPRVLADYRATKQILINLTNNAVKFTQSGGTVEISARVADGKVCLSIADNGPGIPQDKIGAVTDPFERAVGDPYLKSEGWGLGLAITKSLVDLQHGEMEIESVLGQGTTIHIRFSADAVAKLAKSR